MTKFEHEYVVENRGYITACWISQRAKANGYGRQRVNRVLRAAHVVMYEKLKGRVPAGLELDHLCRQRACVNPDHLEPVTHAVNDQRGNTSKLTASQVAAIRGCASTAKDLAEIYGVSEWHIRRLRRGDQWANVSAGETP